MSITFDADTYAIMANLGLPSESDVPTNPVSSMDE